MTGIRVLFRRLTCYLALGMAMAWWVLLFVGEGTRTVTLHVAPVKVYRDQEVKEAVGVPLVHLGRESLANHQELMQRMKTLGPGRLASTFFENRGLWDRFVADYPAARSTPAAVVAGSRLVRILANPVRDGQEETVRLDFTLAGFVADRPVAMVTPDRLVDHPGMEKALDTLVKKQPEAEGVSLDLGQWRDFAEDVIGRDFAPWAFVWQGWTLYSFDAADAVVRDPALVRGKSLPFVLAVCFGGGLAGVLMYRPRQGIPIEAYRWIALRDLFWLLVFTLLAMGAVEQLLTRFFQYQPMLSPAVRLTSMVVFLVCLPIAAWRVTRLAVASVAVDGKAIAFSRLRQRRMHWTELEGVALSDVSPFGKNTEKNGPGEPGRLLVLRGENKRFSIPRPCKEADVKLLTEALVACAPRRWKPVFSDLLAEW